jgi:hypothetical protein
VSPSDRHPLSPFADNVNGPPPPKLGKPTLLSSGGPFRAQQLRLKEHGLCSLFLEVRRVAVLAFGLNPLVITLFSSQHGVGFLYNLTDLKTARYVQYLFFRRNPVKGKNGICTGSDRARVMHKTSYF